MFNRFMALAIILLTGAALHAEAVAQVAANPNDILNQLQQKFQKNQSGLPQYSPSPIDDNQSSSGEQKTGGSSSERNLKIRTKSSNIEREYSRRLGAPIAQFGYDSFTNVDMAPDTLVGGVAENYILGVGDEVVVTLRGQRNTSLRSRVDREGNIILPDLRPISAAGRTFGQFREQLEAEAGAAFLQTEVFVSLGTVREMSIMISGEVQQPGLHRLSGLSSLVGALVAAGGPKPTGSLRTVELIRNGRSQSIDLYSLLLGGRSPADQSLRDGDRVIVPPLRNTIAIAGEVVRPGIYEITGKSLSQAEALQMAGGPLRPEGNRFLLFGLNAGGQEKVIESSASTRISIGEVLRVARSTDARTQWFRVDGHVEQADIRSLGATSTLRALLLTDAQLVKDDAYMLFAVVQTSDPVTQALRFEAIDPSRIRAGQTDYQLRERDTVVFLSMSDIRYLMSADVQAVLRLEQPYHGKVANTSTAKSDDMLGVTEALQKSTEATATTQQAQQGGDRATAQLASTGTALRTSVLQDQTRQSEAERALNACAGLRVLSSMVVTGNISRFPPTSDSLRGSAKDPIANVMPCPDVYNRYPELLPFVLDYVSSLEGEIRRPGMYPVLPGTPVATLINAGGGTTRQADLRQVELSRYEGTGPSLREAIDMQGRQVQASIGPGDGVRVNPLETARELGTVVVRGEISRPGTYSIRRGERLSELLARAGGLGEYAYPIGVVFTRESVRQEEERTYEIAARELEASIPSALASSTDTKSAQAGTAVVQALQGAVITLRTAKASGRVVTEADPTVLQLQPEKDTVLQSGDAIYIPKRPSHVSVVGEVLNPGAQQFQSGVTADQYIKMAGGTRSTADESRTFLVLPSGQARPLAVSSWNFSETQIPPGSTIVVPRDISPFNFWTAARDITQVLSQVAISAASLAVISTK